MDGLGSRISRQTGGCVDAPMGSHVGMEAPLRDAKKALEGVADDSAAGEWRMKMRADLDFPALRTQSRNRRNA
jgi:hypothetical protein